MKVTFSGRHPSSSQRLKVPPDTKTGRDLSRMVSPTLPASPQKKATIFSKERSFSLGSVPVFSTRGAISPVTLSPQTVTHVSPTQNAIALSSEELAHCLLAFLHSDREWEEEAFPGKNFSLSPDAIQQICDGYFGEGWESSMQPKGNLCRFAQRIPFCFNWLLLGKSLIFYAQALGDDEALLLFLRKDIAFCRAKRVSCMHRGREVYRMYTCAIMRKIPNCEEALGLLEDLRIVSPPDVGAHLILLQMCLSAWYRNDGKTREYWEKFKIHTDGQGNKISVNLLLEMPLLRLCVEDTAFFHSILEETHSLSFIPLKDQLGLSLVRLLFLEKDRLLPLDQLECAYQELLPKDGFDCVVYQQYVDFLLRRGRAQEFLQLLIDGHDTLVWARNALIFDLRNEQERKKQRLASINLHFGCKALIALGREAEAMDWLSNLMMKYPKRGELFLERARIHLNPYSRFFNLANAKEDIELGIVHTCQCIGLYLEKCRLLMIYSQLASVREGEGWEVIPIEDIASHEQESLEASCIQAKQCASFVASVSSAPTIAAAKLQWEEECREMLSIASFCAKDNVHFIRHLFTDRDPENSHPLYDLQAILHQHVCRDIGPYRDRVLEGKSCTETDESGYDHFRSVFGVNPRDLTHSPFLPEGGFVERLIPLYFHSGNNLGFIV